MKIYSRKSKGISLGGPIYTKVHVYIGVIILWFIWNQKKVDLKLLFGPGVTTFLSIKWIEYFQLPFRYRTIKKSDTYILFRVNHISVQFPRAFQTQG